MREGTMTDKEIEVEAHISFKVKFKDYGDEKSNDLAMKQIKVWIEETLKEEDQIPLFVMSASGEQTTDKRVLVAVTRVFDSDA